MTQVAIKYSGVRRKFATGAKREGSQKLSTEFLHPLFELVMARWMSFGAVKYDAWNFAKGMPASVFFESAGRHRLKFKLGMTDEDHLAAWAFNLMGLVMLREGVRLGVYDESLWDLPQQGWCGDLTDLEATWKAYEGEVAEVAGGGRS